MPKFSVIVPAYKKAFLKECIDSVLSQTYTDFELVVVNDNSPEDLETIIFEYSDNRIIYKKNKYNYGAIRMVDNWNHCLEYASGEFVMCIGDDDMLTPNCLQEYANIINLYPSYNLYHTRMAIIDENSKITNLQEERPVIESMYSMIWHYWSFQRMQRLGDWLFRASYLNKVGGFVNFSCGWASDDLSAFKCAQLTGVVNVKNIGFMYRQSSLTVSSQSKYAKEKVLAFCQAQREYEDLFRTETSDFINEFYKKELISKLDNKIYNWKMFEIHQDISCRIFNFFIWMGCCKKYRIKRYSILRMGVDVFVEKTKKGLKSII